MLSPAARTDLATAFWALLVAALLLAPPSALPSTETAFALIPQFDKLVHAGLTGVMAWLAARSLARRGAAWPRLTAALAATAYGGLLEVLQGFTGRDPDLLDALANGAGAVVATVAQALLGL